MKHLLNGVAIAAALAIAVPAWAQAPAAAPAAPAAAAPAAGAPMAPMAGKQRHKRMMHGMMRRGAGNNATDELNRQELARIQGGGGMPASPPESSASPYGKSGSPK
jgi:hypothetical protein